MLIARWYNFVLQYCSLAHHWWLIQLSRRFSHHQLPTVMYGSIFLVKITSKSSSSPSFDQIAPLEHVPVIFYYESNVQANVIKTQEWINQLKKSLSQVLTRIYPLAGRVKENHFIECNDEGVDFIEAKVNCSLSEILRQPEINVLDQFVPHEFGSNKSSMETQLAIQVNIFSCGGMAIGTCISHKIVDGGTFSSFINMWAEISRGYGDSLSPIWPSFQGQISSHLEIYQA